MQSMHTTTNVASFNPDLGEGYSIQFVNDLRQACGFKWVLRIPPPIKLSTTI